MTEPAETNEAQNPLTKPKFIISAVVVAILVALGLILALTPKGGGTAAPTASDNTSSATSSPVATPPSVSVCGLAAGDQAKPVTEPAGTDWELVGKVAAPTSPEQYGPGKAAPDGLRSCFAHSPMGALYAAVNVTALSASGKAMLVFEHLAVPSPERDEILKEAQSEVPNSVTAQVSGFKYLSYDSDSAVVDLAFRGANGVYISIPVPLQWYDGDWKLVVTATGDGDSRQLADLSGYIEWAGL